MSFELRERLLLAFIKDNKIILCEVEDGFPLFVGHIDLDELQSDIDFMLELTLFLLSLGLCPVTRKKHEGYRKRDAQEKETSSAHINRDLLPSRRLLYR